MGVTAPRTQSTGTPAVGAGTVHQAWIVRRMPAVTGTLLVLWSGMYYVLGWLSAVHHRPGFWDAPGDLWGSYLSSVALVHGHLGSVYSPASDLVAFPGFEFLLAPVTAIGSALHLDVGPPFSAFTEPTAWVLLGPVVLLLASVVVFGADAVAERLGLPRGRRYALGLVSGALLVPVVVRYGHPEDCLSVGLCLVAMVAMDRGRPQRAAWLLGVAVAVQPLALLAVAPVVARVSWRGLARLVPGLVVPTAVVLAGPLLADWSTVVHTITTQPNFPSLNHPTPFTSLAPRTTSFGNAAVAAGPGRLVAPAVAVVVGAAVCRRRHDLATVVTVTAGCWFLRLAGESVLDSYYVWPVLALAVVVAADRSTLRLWLTAVLAGATMWWSDRPGPAVWPWWTALIVLALVTLGTAVAPRPRPAALAGAGAGP